MGLHEWARDVLAPLGQAPAAHHRELLDALDEVASGNRDRLLVMMPPGSAKSTYASVIFPAWWMLTHPKSAVLAVSYTGSVAAHFGRRVRDLVAEHGGALAHDDSAAGRFSTTAGASYFATGACASLAGRRADLVVIDDPVKSAAEADSAAARDALWDWFRSDLTTRLTPRGRMVLVMTRWHQDDIAGRLLASGDGWRTLCLPMLDEAAVPFCQKLPFTAAQAGVWS